MFGGNCLRFHARCLDLMGLAMDDDDEIVVQDEVEAPRGAGPGRMQSERGNGAGPGPSSLRQQQQGEVVSMQRELDEVEDQLATIGMQVRERKAERRPTKRQCAVTQFD